MSMCVYTYIYSIDYFRATICIYLYIYISYCICLYSVGALSNRELTRTIITFTSQAIQTDPGSWLKNPRAASSVLKRNFAQKFAPEAFGFVVFGGDFGLVLLFVHAHHGWVKVIKPHKMDALVLKILKHLKWSIGPPFLPKKVYREDWADYER